MTEIDNVPHQGREDSPLPPEACRTVGECDDGPATQRDRPFNPYRVPASDTARGFCREVAEQVSRFEETAGTRKRRRARNEEETFRAAVSALVSDAAYHALTGEPGRLTVPRNKQFLGRASRYKPWFMGEAFIGYLDTLSSPGLGLLSQVRASPCRPRGGEELRPRTTIAAGPRLLCLLQAHGLTAGDFREDAAGEGVLLKGVAAGFWDDKALVEYADDERTRRYRAELAAINASVGGADIGLQVSALSRPRYVDPNARRLSRHFTQGDFTCGGRLFGGFWLAMSKEERKAALTINGEPVVALDYNAMNPRILYGLARAELPMPDPYVIPGLEGHRKGAKVLVNAMLFSDKPLTRKPKRKPKDPADLFPGRPMAELREAIRSAHSAVAHLLEVGIGHRLQYIESEVLVSALLRLIALGVVALPVHDCLVVPASKAGTAKRVMEEVFYEKTGAVAVVVVE